MIHKLNGECFLEKEFSSKITKDFNTSKLDVDKFYYVLNKCLSDLEKTLLEDHIKIVESSRAADFIIYYPDFGTGFITENEEGIIVEQINKDLYKNLYNTPKLIDKSFISIYEILPLIKRNFEIDLEEFTESLNNIIGTNNEMLFEHALTVSNINIQNKEAFVSFRNKINNFNNEFVEIFYNNNNIKKIIKNIWGIEYTEYSEHFVENIIKTENLKSAPTETI
jgi:hypothetical protein